MGACERGRAPWARYFRPMIAISITQSVICRLLVKLLAYAVGREEGVPCLMRSRHGARPQDRPDQPGAV